MVLGVQLLTTLGLVTIDYKNLTMSFHINEGNIARRNCYVSKTFTIITVAKTIIVDLVVYFYNLVTQTNYSSIKTTNNKALEALLGRFQEVFEAPSSLSPLRDI